MKRTFALILCICLISGASLAEGFDVHGFIEEIKTVSDDELYSIYRVVTDEVNRRKDGKEIADPQEESAAKPEYTATFRNCTIDYLGAELIEQFDTPAVVVRYNMTNTGAEPVTFMGQVSDTAFQNGIQLTPWALVDGEENNLAKVLPGYSIEVASVFMLKDTESPVTLIVDSSMDIANVYDDMQIQINLK